ncbi:hypothetical protein [Lysobacter soyae]|jgi:hypothetical protein|uniref:Uncharacterized protein n=1 Tax=Lysobacter soyae TaxID=2764185 RepID=A0ABX8WLU6_9GAMM|nr:hypothetical protein [Lysobacter sp. CJ11]QYR52100.1 hypothetical protein H8L67_05605 [Lysobacter sp. CJ11]
MGKALRCVAGVLGVIWTLPNSLVGAILGCAGLPFGAHAHLRKDDWALVFHRWPWGPGGAITFGNVIVHTGDDLDTPCLTYATRAGRAQDAHIRLNDHERAHVFQYMVFGVLFLPLYLACGGVSVRNPFERAADRYALSGRGWWPFQR